MARQTKKTKETSTTDTFWKKGNHGRNEITGGMVISRTLKGMGINSVFSLAGASHTYLLDALDRDDFAIVSNRHETATVAAADGYARVTGKPGVALIISDQGVPNAVSGILTAHEACSPVIVIVARLPTNWIQPQSEVDHDALALVRPITKWARTVHSAERLREYVETAYRQATTGRPGPVVLQVPQEFLAQTVENVEDLDAPVTRAIRPGPAVDAVAAAADLIAKARAQCGRAPVRPYARFRPRGTFPCSAMPAAGAWCPRTTNSVGRGRWPRSRPRKPTSLCGWARG